MKKERCCTTLLLHLLLASGVLMFNHEVFAQLGESEHSTALNQQMPEARIGSIRAGSHYSVRERVSARYTIREFISQSGTIFAVAWSGQTRPNLMYLLGSYYPEYERALQESIRQQPPLTKPFRQVKTNNILVEHWGLPRDLKGRAIAPALIPQGVDVNEIK